MAIDLSKQQTLDAVNTTMFFIIEESKETILYFLQGTVKVLWMCSTILFCSNIILWPNEKTLRL